MRILFLAQLLPLPLDAGPKTRSYYVLRRLAAAGHEVSLVCFRRPGDGQGSVADLLKFCSTVDTVPLVRSRVKDVASGVASMFSPLPFLIRRDDFAPMRRTIKGITRARSFDAVHADQLWMAPYGLDCGDVAFKVLDQHNATFLAVRRMAQQTLNPLAQVLVRKEAAKLETFEGEVCRAFNRVVWVTENDRMAIAGAGQCNGRDRVIPIAIDPGAQPPVKRPHPFRVTFLGGMHWPPNADGISWFANAVWPKVAQAAPGCVLTVIGKRPPHGLCRFAGDPRVEIAGFVPDPGRYLSETAVFVAPIRSGAGMRVKILDAWCWGLPVVSTTLGAEGLEALSGENLLLADDAESFAQCVIEVLSGYRVARRLAENGRATVEAYYDWTQVYEAWDRVYA